MILVLVIALDQLLRSVSRVRPRHSVARYAQESRLGSLMLRTSLGMTCLTLLSILFMVLLLVLLPFSIIFILLLTILFTVLLVFMFFFMRCFILLEEGVVFMLFTVLLA